MFNTIRQRAFACKRSPMLTAPKFWAVPVTPMRQFSKLSNESDDVKNVPRISLDDFYSSLTDFSLTDEEALEYMKFSARLGMVSFKDDDEMLSFKNDFQAALAFIGKLDEVDVSIPTVYL